MKGLVGLPLIRSVVASRERLASGVVWGLFVVFVVGIAVTKPQFVSPYNLISILMLVSVYALLSFGETAVLLIAGIDLSVGSIVGFSGVVAAVVIGQTQGLAWAGVGLLVGAAAGLLVGALNGVLIGLLNMPSFVATLGTLSIALSAGYIVSSGLQISIINNQYLNFTQLTWLHIPIPVYVMFAVFFVLLFLLSRTRFGRNLYAVGGNIRAAYVAGLPVRRVTMMAFATSGLLSGIAGVVLASQVTAGIATTGTGYELTAIAAPVIGGVSLFGGKGSLWGTLLGVILLGTVDNGLNILNVSPFFHDGVKGAVIVIAVYIDTVVNRRKLVG